MIVQRLDVAELLGLLSGVRADVGARNIEEPDARARFFPLSSSGDTKED